MQFFSYDASFFILVFFPFFHFIISACRQGINFRGAAFLQGFIIKMSWRKSPVFDSFLRKKVPEPALVAFGTSVHFTDARYAFYFFVREHIFLIFFIETIYLEVQNPNASWSASVIFILV